MTAERFLKAMLRYPPTWAVAGTLVALEWGFFSWFGPSAVMSAAGLALGLLMLLAWPVLLSRSRSFASILLGAQTSTSDRDGDKLLRLERDLGRLGSEQGMSQLRLLRQKLDKLTDVLRRRLDDGELTYGRYLGTAEQVYLSAVDNLHEVTVALTSQSGIDGTYIEERIRALGGRNSESKGTSRELETLYERRALLKQQHDKVAELLTQNEEAMTVLDNTTAALAGTRTRKGHASMSAEEAMRELEMLASRTSRYASDHQH